VVRQACLRLRPADLGAWLMLALAPLSARAEPPPPCLATVDLSSPTAVVGQQIVYRVRILSLDGVAEADWVAPERVSDFRIEWLPGRTKAEPEQIEGVSYRVRLERRALFPQRPGELRVAASTLRCRIAGSDGGTFEVTAPAASLSVSEPPAVGRPPDFAGLVGPVSLQAIVTPSEIHLGESVRLAFMLRGNGNVWEVDDLLGSIADAEVFPRRPELHLETGPLLALVKHFAYDVVPIHAGELVFPAARVAYFDPESASFATATSQPLRIRVGPRATATTLPIRDGEPAKAAMPVAVSPLQTPATTPARSTCWIVAVVIVAGLGISVLLFRRHRARTPRGAALAAALADLAPDEDLAKAFARALRAGLGPHLPTALWQPAEEIATLPDVSEIVADAALLLLAVERARFDPKAGGTRALRPESPATEPRSGGARTVPAPRTLLALLQIAEGTQARTTVVVQIRRLPHRHSHRRVLGHALGQRPGDLSGRRCTVVVPHEGAAASGLHAAEFTNQPRSQNAIAAIRADLGTHVREDRPFGQRRTILQERYQRKPSEPLGPGPVEEIQQRRQHVDVVDEGGDSPRWKPGRV